MADLITSQIADLTMADGLLSDRISSLPDKLLTHILSFLPSTRTRTRTAVLSKRWRHLSASIPSLDLPFEGGAIDDYHRTVDRILDRYPHPTLTRLRVDDRAANHHSFSRSNDDLLAIRRLSMDPFDRWIRFAASKSVSELDLIFHHPFPDLCDNPRVPQSLLHLCPQTLTSLKLTSLCFPRFPDDFGGFPFLKTLILKSVLFVNSDALAELLAVHCPSLEYLVIEKSHWVPNVTVTQTSFPNLERLKFVDYVERSPENLNTEAPNLRHFYFSGALECLHLRNCRRLRSAHIRSAGKGLTSCLRLMEILGAFASVEVLVVGYWFFPHFWHWHWQWNKVFLCKDQPLCNNDTYPVPVFEKLREFHCHGIFLHRYSMKAFLVFICKCPLLEKLCINFDFYNPGLPKFNEREESNPSSSMEMDIIEHFDEPCSGREEGQKQILCHPDLQLRLKTVTITQFSDDRTYMRMLRFILEKSPALELLQVNFVQQQHVELEQLQERISCFSCASPFVKIKLLETEVSDHEQCRGKCSPLDHLWSY